MTNSTGSQKVVVCMSPSCARLITVASCVLDEGGLVVAALPAERLQQTKRQFRDCPEIACIIDPGIDPNRNQEFFSHVKEKYGRVDTIVVEAGSSPNFSESIAAVLGRLVACLNGAWHATCSGLQIIVIGPDYLFPIAAAAMKATLQLPRVANVAESPIRLTVVFTSRSRGETRTMESALIQVEKDISVGRQSRSREVDVGATRDKRRPSQRRRLPEAARSHPS